MKTEITFAQVAHLYLRSDLRALNLDRDEKWKHYLSELYKMGYDMAKFIPIFQPFENLIKPVKANKFVAELLGINEGDGYVMAHKICPTTVNARYEFYLSQDCVQYNIIGFDENILLINNTFTLGNARANCLTLLIAAGYNVFNIKDCKYGE